MVIICAAFEMVKEYSGIAQQVGVGNVETAPNSEMLTPH